MQFGLGLTPAHEFLDALNERGVKVPFVDVDDRGSSASVSNEWFGPQILVIADTLRAGAPLRLP